MLHDLTCHLFAPMGGEAVQEDRAIASRSKERGVHLEPLERFRGLSEFYRKHGFDAESQYMTKVMTIWQEKCVVQELVLQELVQI